MKAAERDYDLLDAMDDLVDRLAESKCHVVTDPDSPRVILEIDITDMPPEEAVGCETSSPTCPNQTAKPVVSQKIRA